MRIFVFLALLSPIMAFELQIQHSPAMDAMQVKQARIMENEIRAILECIRDVLMKGDPETGFPSFDALDIKEINMNLDSLNLQGLSGHLNITNLYVNGIPYWDLEKLKISITLIPVGAKIVAKISWDIGDLRANYDANANIFDHTIIGAGEVKGDIVNLVFELESQATINPIKIKSIIFKPSLFSSHLTFEQLAIDGDDVSDKVEEFVSNIPNLLKKNADTIQKMVDDIVLPAINAILQAITNGGMAKITGYEIPIFGHCFRV